MKQHHSQAFLVIDNKLALAMLVTVIFVFLFLCGALIPSGTTGLGLGLDALEVTKHRVHDIIDKIPSIHH